MVDWLGTAKDTHSDCQAHTYAEEGKSLIVSLLFRYSLQFVYVCVCVTASVCVCVCMHFIPLMHFTCAAHEFCQIRQTTFGILQSAN